MRAIETCRLSFPFSPVLAVPGKARTFPGVVLARRFFLAAHYRNASAAFADPPDRFSTIQGSSRSLPDTTQPAENESASFLPVVPTPGQHRAIGRPAGHARREISPLPRIWFAQSAKPGAITVAPKNRRRQSMPMP